MPRKILTDEARADGLRLGRALASERSAAGLSGGELAGAAGVSVDTVRSVETGRVVSPGFLVVAALCRALGVSLDVLAERVREGGAG